MRHAALETLAKLAPDTAAAAAQTIALSGGDTSDRTHAAELALRLARGAAAELARADGAAVVRVAVPHLTDEPAQLDRLRELLDDDDDGTRAAAARRLAELVDRDELLNTLDIYIQQGTYYYNVASVLDASIHAPEPYRAWYLEGTAPF